MARLFDESSDNIQIGDNAVFSFPDADWAIGGWLKLTDNVGTEAQYFYSHDQVNTTPSFNMQFQEASASDPNTFNLFFNSTRLLSTGTYGTSTDWQHILLQRSSTTVTLYVDNVADATTISVSAATDPTGNVYLGERQDETAGRELGGDMAEWAKWDVALDSEQRAGLVSGFSPRMISPTNLAWYLPLIGRTSPEIELVGGNNGTVAGAVASAHPHIIYPRHKRVITVPTVVAGGLSIPVAMHSYKRRRVA